MDNLTPVNLHISLPWHKVLTALQIDVPSHVLPCDIRCPFCAGNRMRIYQDSRFSGQWHHCADCKAAGGMLELAARCWQSTHLETLQQLSAEISELQPWYPEFDGLARYEVDYLNARKVANDFWLKTSAERLDLAFDVLGIHSSTLDAARWQLGPGTMLGEADNDAANTFLDAQRERNPENYHYEIAKRKWRRCVVVPIMDLPGRISAFLLYGNHEGVTELLSYHDVYHVYSRNMGNAPGLACASAIFGEQSGVVDKLFVFFDPVLTMRLHAGHLLLSNKLLPLVAVHKSADACTFASDCLPGVHVILCYPEDQALDADVLRHAQGMNAYIARLPNNDRLLRLTARHAESRWLDELERTAQSWSDALEGQLLTISVPEADALLRKLHWPGTSSASWLAGCSRQLRQHLQKLYDQTLPRRQLQMGKHIIVEDEQGWWLERTGCKLSNAVIRLQRLVHSATEPDYYQGSVRQFGRQFEFTEKAELVEGHTVSWLRNLLARKAGTVFDFDADWQGRLLSVAKGFYKPAVAPGITAYGWSEHHRAFMLPRHQIDLGGKVSEHGLPLPDSLGVPQLPCPGPLGSADIMIMSACNGPSALLWLLAAFVLHNLLAEKFKCRRVGLLYDGGQLRDLARAAGCPIRQRRQRRPPAGWPEIISGRFKVTERLLRRLSRPRVCLIEVDDIAALPVLATWLVCRTANIADIQKIDDLPGRVILAFLLAMAKRHLIPWTAWKDGSFQETVSNLQAWFRECSGAETPRNCLDLLVAPTEMKDANNRQIALVQSGQ